MAKKLLHGDELGLREPQDDHAVDSLLILFGYDLLPGCQYRKLITIYFQDIELGYHVQGSDFAGKVMLGLSTCITMTNEPERRWIGLPNERVGNLNGLLRSELFYRFNNLG